MYLYSQPVQRAQGLRTLGALPRRAAWSLAPRRRYLGQATAPASIDTSILATLCPSGVGKSPCQTKNVNIFTSFLQQAIDSRTLPLPTQQTASTNCSGQATASGAQQAAKITAAAAGVATGVTQSLSTSGAIAAGSAVGTVVPIVGTIVGAIAGLLGGIFAHHAQAVAEQSDVLCTNVPAFNAALAAIQQALSVGSITPAQASSDYDSLLSQFQSALKSDPSYKTGDALYGYNLAAQAVVAALKQDLQTAAAATGGTAGGLSLGAGLPGWALLLGAGVLIYFLA